MVPLVDMHCHLLPGLDDGPESEEESVAMCRVAYGDGSRLVAAAVHQSGQYEDTSPQRILRAARRLADRLRHEAVPLTIFPCGEVMAQPDLTDSWNRGELLSVANRGQYLIVEMPHGLFVDLRRTVTELRRYGVRTILAHPERCPELLYEPGTLEELIRLGCLVQVSAESVTDPPSRRARRAIKGWIKGGLVHLLGSDGHGPQRRPPRVSKAFLQIACWVGHAAADRICTTHGMAVLQGLPLRIPVPRRRRRLFALR